MRNSRREEREEREEAATATEASSRPSLLSCLRYASQLRANSLVRLRYSQVLTGYLPEEAESQELKKCLQRTSGSNFALKIELTLT